MDEAFPGKPTWSPEQLKDQSGKVFVITGGYAGIGKETTKNLLLKNATVYIAGRSRSKFDACAKDLHEEAKGLGKLDFVELDLGSARKARKGAERLIQMTNRLDVLINCAGVMTPPNGSTTEDGWEIQFGTNVLGHHAWTRTLLPLILETAKTAPKGSVRIVTVSSQGAASADPKGIDLSEKNLRRGTNEGRNFLNQKEFFKDYSVSKLGNYYQMRTLHRRYSSQNLVSLSLNPGVVKSELQRTMPKHAQCIVGIIGFDVQRGALNSIFCAADESLNDKSGSHIVPWTRIKPLDHPKANDEKAMDDLWDWCEKHSA
ncbi:NAD-binding protein [Atractiella rhizophila]|nr:NAD-binding protein [Atractiella rhizophila]